MEHNLCPSVCQQCVETISRQTRQKCYGPGIQPGEFYSLHILSHINVVLDHSTSNVYIVLSHSFNRRTQIQSCIYDFDLPCGIVVLTTAPLSRLYAYTPGFMQNRLSQLVDPAVDVVVFANTNKVVQIPNQQPIPVQPNIPHSHQQHP